MSEPVVVITGASGNLGRAIAATFASRGSKLVLIDRRREALDGAFDTLTRLMLRAQLADAREGRRPDNFIRPDSLSKAERSALVEALRAVDDFLARTRADFTGRLLG